MRNRIASLLPRAFAYAIASALTAAFAFAAPLASLLADARIPAAQRISSLKSPISLADSRKGQASEHGWRIRTDEVDVQAASNLKESAPSSVWHAVRVPYNLNRNRALKDVAVVWYRKVLILPDFRGPLALELGQISDRDETYFNGRRIGSTGHWDANHAQAFDKVRVYHIPTEIIRRGSPNVILVRVQRFHGYHFGIHRGEIRIGPRDALIADIYTREYRIFMFISFYAAVAAFFLFLFAARPKDRENLYFGLFVFFLVIHLITRGTLKYELGLSLDFVKTIENIATLLFPIALWSYIRRMFGVPGNVMRRLDYWYYRIMLVIMVGSALAVGFKMKSEFGFMLFFNFYIYALVPVTVFIFTILIRMAVRGNRDARYILLGFLIFIISAVFDVLRAWGFVQLPTLIDFGFFVLVMGMAAILVKNYVFTMNRVEDLNKNLEVKVQERTRELEKSLVRVRSLKRKQDGDYFLTSLLLQPLNHNTAVSGSIEVETVTKQKKRFSFRGKRHELGGDIVVVDNLVLAGRNYVVFMNGDAMGKSMQGAGGALVLGAVFRALIERTRITAAARSQYPEQWLRSCLIELQSVFVSFDGSMLASAVLGLIDEESGVLYHINVEHPGSVLFRDGRARFLDYGSTMYKIGTQGIEAGLRIHITCLRPGDVLYFGSDGRDDIFLGYDGGGNRIINEDENLFLRTLESADGRLDRLLGLLRSHGRFIDDLTLIRISYREDADAVLTPSPEVDILFEQHVNLARTHVNAGNMTQAIEEYEHAIRARKPTEKVAREYARLLLKAGRHDIAAEKSEELLLHFPSTFQLLAYAACAHKKSGDLDTAADLGERCRLREPDYAWNLVNLADVYRLKGMHERAARLIKRVLRKQPEHENAREIDRRLKTAVH